MPPAALPAFIPESERRYHLLTEHAPDGIAVFVDGIVVYCNPSCARMLGGEAPDDIIGRKVFDFIAQTYHAIARQRIAQLLSDDNVVMPPIVEELIRLDGSRFYIELTSASFRWDDKIAVQAVIRDIGARRQADSNQRLADSVLEHAGEAVLITNAQGEILRVNPAFCQLTGFQRKDVIGQPLARYSKQLAEPRQFADMQRAVRRHGHWRNEVWSQRQNGEPYCKLVSVSSVCDAEGQISHYFAVFTDITELKQTQRHLEQLSNYDPLTGLANRRQWMSLLGSTIARLQLLGESFALVLLDIDNFKQINDSLGHPIGDQLLCAVAERITASLDQPYVAARLSADEFIVLLAPSFSRSTVQRYVERLCNSLTLPLRLDGQEVFTSASCGVAVFPQDGKDAATLMRHADTALFNAKSEGKNQYRFFTPTMREALDSRLRLENALRRALAHQEFVLFFQPKVDLDSGDISGAEALLRWNNAELGSVSPTDFIPLAESSGLIIELGEWVFSQACWQLARWRDAGCWQDGWRVAVNVSAKQFRQNQLANRIADALARWDIPAHWLEIELTESALMENPPAAIRTLQQLRNMGLTIAVDDFGTGYSSLSYLKRFPLDSLKIDRSFVLDIVSNPDDAAIANAIIAMAHQLGLKVVAEGVEDAEQLAQLRARRCDQVQGYFYSRPLPADTFAAWSNEFAKLQALHLQESHPSC